MRIAGFAHAVRNLLRFAGVPGWHLIATAPARAEDLDVSLPRKAAVVASTRYGDVSVTGRDGNIRHGILAEHLS